MKNFKAILIILLVISVTVAVMQFTKKNNPEVSSAPVLKRACYIWSTEAGDKAQISMDITGENVIGEFNFLPAEKDKKTGTFTGTLRSLDGDPNKQVVDATWNTHAEGMVTDEQLWINIVGSVASPGFGEMKDRGDGTYVYADPTHVSYDLNLQQTDCGDGAMN